MHSACMLVVALVHDRLDVPAPCERIHGEVVKLEDWKVEVQVGQ